MPLRRRGAGDDPTGPREASGRMRVFLPFGVSFQGRDQRFKGFNLRFREDGRGRQLVPAVTFLHQLHIDTRGFYRRACPCEGGGR
jgi:hypothetical protein